MKHLTCVQNFSSLNAWSSTPYSQCSPYPHSWIRCVLAEKGNFERVSTLQLVNTTSRVSRGLFTLPLYFILRNFLTVRLARLYQQPKQAPMNRLPLGELFVPFVCFHGNTISNMEPGPCPASAIHTHDGTLAPLVWHRRVHGRGHVEDGSADGSHGA